MAAILQPLVFETNDRDDLVEIRLGDLRPTVPYQTAFEIAQALRVAAKAAARADNAPANFWREFQLEDPLQEFPRQLHQGFRRSTRVPNVTAWQVVHQGGRVRIIFDGTFTEFGYEEAIKLHHQVRRAGHRAKRWAGDTSRTVRSVGRLVDAEENARLSSG